MEGGKRVEGGKRDVGREGGKKDGGREGRGMEGGREEGWREPFLSCGLVIVPPPYACCAPPSVPSFCVLVIWLSHIIVILSSQVVVICGDLFVGHSCCLGGQLHLCGLSLALGIMLRLAWGLQWLTGHTTMNND